MVTPGGHPGVVTGGNPVPISIGPTTSPLRGTPVAGGSDTGPNHAVPGFATGLYTIPVVGAVGVVHVTYKGPTELG